MGNVILVLGWALLAAVVCGVGVFFLWIVSVLLQAAFAPLG